MAKVTSANDEVAFLRFVLHERSKDLHRRIKNEGLVGFAALSRTSRSLQEVLEPELYHTVFLDNSTRVESVQRVLKKLDKRADLAAKVQRLELGWADRGSLMGPMPPLDSASLCGALGSMTNLVTLRISQSNLDWGALASHSVPLPQLRRLSMVGTPDAVPWIQTVLPQLTHLAFSGPQVTKDSFWRAIADSAVDGAGDGAPLALQYLQSSISLAVRIVRHTLNGAPRKKLAPGCTVHIIENTADQITERDLTLLGKAGELIRVLGFDGRAVGIVWTLLKVKSAVPKFLPRLRHLLLGLPDEGIKIAEGFPRQIILDMFLGMHTRFLLECCPELETLTFDGDGDLHDILEPRKYGTYGKVCPKLVGVRHAESDLCFVRSSGDSDWQSTSSWPVQGMGSDVLDPFGPPRWAKANREEPRSPPRNAAPSPPSGMGGLEFLTRLREAGADQGQVSMLARAMMSMREAMRNEERGNGEQGV